MANYISEENIQKRLGQLLTKSLKYSEFFNCQYDDTQLGRRSNKEVVSIVRLRKALHTINDQLDQFGARAKEEAITLAIKTMTRNRSALELLAANKEVHLLLKNGFKTSVKDDKSKKQPVKVVYLDFYHPDNNEFIVVEELPIIGKKSCRPDIVLFVNGLPLVFMELKNSNIDVKTAYTDNLYRYKRNIRSLFHYTAFIILSNGIDTRVGGITATWEHFSEWKRLESEKESYDAKEDGISLERATKGMCDKKRLLDLIENFIFYFSDKAKIVAKNHQYIGVNNAVASFEKSLTLTTEDHKKLGVFWHTQGSGKSFSMIFFTMKVFRKFRGNYTFVIITDRDSLDQQIYKNFLSAEAVGEKEEAQALSGEHLKTMLGKKNKRYIFTLVQKFGTAQGETYPLLTERKDIIVLVDEAHRTQYNTYANNMRAAMPNAKFLAFTGTPLLDANETTRKHFGEYISEYNFAQSMEDGATVPLFYDNRVPTVQLNNEELNEEFKNIVENDNLSDAEEKKLAQKFASQLEVIKRESRLDTIAKDIVAHFPYREYKGKAMVISIDKYTTVKMYDKVNKYWGDEKRKLNKQIKTATNPEEKAEHKAVLDFMKKTEMHVVISKDGDEDTKFSKVGLHIRTHREAMDKRYGKDKLRLKDRFPKDDDPFRLVFVCSKWLTGFDCPTLNTLYLDKPMQNHTLMQSIARANRVSKDKTCGIIVDYFGVFENLEKALEKYGKKHNDKLKDSDKPVQNKDFLIDLLGKAVAEGKAFLAENDCDIDLIINSKDAFKKLTYFEKFANNLCKTEEIRKGFNVHDNAIGNLYKATQPDAKVSKDFKRTKEAYSYLRDIVDRKNQSGNFIAAAQKTNTLMDESIEANAFAEPMEKYSIQRGEEVDLRTIQLDKVEKKFKESNYQYLAIVDLKEFLQQQLERMLKQNTTRIDFAVKLQEVIDKYNSKDSDVTRFFDELKAYAEKLQKEDLRHIREGLTEKELQIFDLLSLKKKMTKAQKQAVKLAAKDLLVKLKSEHEKIMVVDWHKRQSQCIDVEYYIMKQLWEKLGEVYDDKKTFRKKSKEVYNFLFEEAENGNNRAYA